MKHYLLAAISAAALTLGACKKEEAPPVATATDPVSDMAVPTAPVENPGQAFANTAAASDAFEIETSKLAASKAQSAKIKTFAENMIKAHTDSTAKLKAAAGAATPVIVPSPALTPAQQATVADLQGKSGADFDQAYAVAQVDAHQKALDGLKAYSSSGDVPSLKTLAGELVPIVTAHLNMAKGL